MLGARAFEEPGPEPVVDLLIAGLGMASLEILPHHAPAGDEEIEGGSEPRGSGFAGVLHLARYFITAHEVTSEPSTLTHGAILSPKP